MIKKVLIIAYYFPPVGGGGVQRTSKFVKYLPELKWEPVVLTVKKKIFKKTNRQLDISLLEDIPKGVHVVRTDCIDLGNISKTIKTQLETRSVKSSLKSLINKIAGLLINPDSQMLWIPVATMVGLKLIKKHKIDIIFSTANPWSDHIIGLILKKLSGLPWIADYRDPWNLNPYITISSSIRKRIQMVLETNVIKYANRVIFTTDGMRNDYDRVFGNSKFVTIRNGYDPSDFINVKKKKFSKITFLYSGSMQPYRGPSYFISALSNWLEKNPRARNELMINILGRVNEEARSLIEKKGLQDIVNLIGYVSHKESIAYLMGADIPLSIVNMGGDSIIPGKIFEYFASGKPILALVAPTGSAANILRKEQRGEYIVSPRDILTIEDKLESLYIKFKNGCLPEYPVDNLEAYTRRKTAEELSKLFNEEISQP